MYRTRPVLSGYLSATRIKKSKTIFTSDICFVLKCCYSFLLINTIRKTNKILGQGNDNFVFGVSLSRNTLGSVGIFCFPENGLAIGKANNLTGETKCLKRRHQIHVTSRSVTVRKDLSFFHYLLHCICMLLFQKKCKSCKIRNLDGKNLYICGWI